MTASAILNDLLSSGAKLAVINGEIDIDAPEDVLTDEVLDTLRQHKVELLAFLTESGELQEERWLGGDISISELPDGYISQIQTSREPRISKGGDLILPLEHWKSGKSIAITLAELNAPVDTWRRYLVLSEAILNGKHNMQCGTPVQSCGTVRFCPSCLWFAIEG